MKIKHIALVTSMALYSHLATGAVSEVPDELQHSTEFDSPLLNELNNFNDSEFPSSEVDALTEGTYNTILKLLTTKQLETAQIKIEDFRKKSPSKPDPYNLQAMLEVLKLDYKAAVKSYQKALKLDPENLKANLGLAAVYLELGDLILASDHANAAITINNKAIAALFVLAEIAAKEGRTQSVENLYLNAQAKTEGYLKYELLVANRLVKFYTEQKQPEKSLKLAEDITKRYPYNSAALALQARIQLSANKTTDAIQTLEKLVNKDKKDSYHRLQLISLLNKQPGNEQKILSLLKESSKLLPDNTEVLIQTTIYQTQQKQFSDALASAKKVQQLVPDSGKAEILEGNIYLAQKKFDLALNTFKKSYQISANTEVMNLITNILVAQGKHAEATQFLEQQLNNPPKNILTEHPDNIIVLNNLAWLYHLQNDPRAVDLAAKAYQKAPKSAAVADSYGVILVSQGSLSKGIEVLDKARKLAPGNYDVRYHLADAYAKNGQTKKAISLLKTIVRSKKDFQEKKSANSLLNSLRN